MRNPLLSKFLLMSRLKGSQMRDLVCVLQKLAESQLIAVLEVLNLTSDVMAAGETLRDVIMDTSIDPVPSDVALHEAVASQSRIQLLGQWPQEGAPAPAGQVSAAGMGLDALVGAPALAPVAAPAAAPTAAGAPSIALKPLAGLRGSNSGLLKSSLVVLNLTFSSQSDARTVRPSQHSLSMLASRR